MADKYEEGMYFDLVLTQVNRSDATANEVEFEISALI